MHGSSSVERANKYVNKLLKQFSSSSGCHRAKEAEGKERWCGGRFSSYQSTPGRKPENQQEVSKKPWGNKPPQRHTRSHCLGFLLRSHVNKKRSRELCTGDPCTRGDGRKDCPKFWVWGNDPSKGETSTTRQQVFREFVPHRLSCTKW